jgi:hypothetical protein
MIRYIESRTIAYVSLEKNAFTFYTCAILRHRSVFRNTPERPPG